MGDSFIRLSRLGQRGSWLVESRDYTGGVNDLLWPEFAPLGRGEVHLYWGWVGAEQSIAAHNLSKSETERAGVFRFERDRRAFLARRSFLRLLLGRHSGLDPAALSIESGPHGKPFLAGDGGLHFSSSNSAERFLIAIGRSGPLGVDLQECRLGEEPAKMARGVFSPLECQQLGEAPQAEQEALFFRGWTRKEAALKALGTGFMQEARELHVGLGAPPPGGAPWSVAEEPKLQGLGLLDLDAAPGFSAALCAPGCDWSLRSFEMTPESSS